MRAREFLSESTGQKKDVFIDMFKKFLPIAIKHIGLKDLPRMVFLANIDDDEQPTFGRYVNDEKTLYVTLANRHPNDILRTIAHELTHYKQDTEHALHASSGETGSEHENEANATAGIVLRHFNKNYPEYLKVKPVVVESKIKEIFDPKSAFDVK
jgi:Zn-dependent peptidase ImmA (M78 family)